MVVLLITVLLHISNPLSVRGFEKKPIDVSACISISIACIAHATTGQHALVTYCTCAHATYVIEMQPGVGGGGGVLATV
jgi:hypothetical protein